MAESWAKDFLGREDVFAADELSTKDQANPTPTETVELLSSEAILEALEDRHPINAAVSAQRQPLMAAVAGPNGAIKGGRRVPEAGGRSVVGSSSAGPTSADWP
jgi:hypothetical protein